MIYFTSDTHFNHHNIIKYCHRSPGENGTERVFKDVGEMNEHMVEMWNYVVQPEDTVYHLGDVFFGPKHEAITLCNRLNGHKVLIKGNHDLKPKPEFWEEAGFSETVTLGHRKTHKLEVGGKVYHLSHYPYVEDLMEYDERTYLHHHAPTSDNIPLLHGHVHDRWQTKGNMINVGVDVWNYVPVSLPAIDLLVKLSKGNP
jgi:calcineurin-like phosphoesterase family protein